jgi:hypothetical protein
VVVVEVDENRGEKQALLAAFAGARIHGVEAIEKPVEVARGVRAFTRQPIHRLVSRAERA